MMNAMTPPTAPELRPAATSSRGPGELRRDALLAAGTAVVMATVAWATFRLAPPDLAPAPGLMGWALAAVIVQSLALVLRRVALGACVAIVVLTHLGLVALVPEASLRTIAVVIVAVTVGSRLPVRRALLTAVAAAGAEAAGGGLISAARGAGAASVLQHVVSPLAVWGACVMVGIYLATRREKLLLLQERAERVEKDRDARVRAAVHDERSRLARELHDVAAHHLSGMVVQAAAVERLVERDPEAARAGAAWLREQGRETLDNLRRVVGLLREDDGDPVAPLPGIAALPDLVAAARASGDDVTLEASGSTAVLSPLADVSVYRVAQQALSNARQHAPGGPVRFQLTREASVVTLEVTNGPGAPGRTPDGGERGGAGLAVMGERAELVGGELEVGPIDRGGWRVWLRLPVEDDGNGGGAVGGTNDAGGTQR